jgi:hypothetical protein
VGVIVKLFHIMIVWSTAGTRTTLASFGCIIIHYN